MEGEKISELKRKIYELKHEYMYLEKDVNVGLQFLPAEIAKLTAKRFVEVSNQLKKLHDELETLDDSP